MKLHGTHTSPFTRHCRIALIDSGMPFEFVVTDAVMSAELSPTKRVPFLVWNENGSPRRLTDSSAILKYVRESSGVPFFESVEEFNRFCTANTLIDTLINLFYMERDGFKLDQSPYLARQHNRVQAILEELEALPLSENVPFDDATLRLGCGLDWALFRNRITLTPFPKMTRMLDQLRAWPPFAETPPHD